MIPLLSLVFLFLLLLLLALSLAVLFQPVLWLLLAAALSSASSFSNLTFLLWLLQVLFGVVQLGFCFGFFSLCFGFCFSLCFGFCFSLLLFLQPLLSLILLFQLWLLQVLFGVVQLRLLLLLLLQPVLWLLLQLLLFLQPLLSLILLFQL